MKKMLIIPRSELLDEYDEISKNLNLGFEYNDFAYPSILDDESKIEELIKMYSPYKGNLNTMHGAFFDVIVFSYDKKIADISKMRVRQSLIIARKLGCAKCVFHTNIDPNLKQDYYVRHWLDESAKFFKQMGEEFPDIEIVIENMFDDSPYMLKKLLDEINLENVRACLDIAHAHISKTPIDEWIDVLDPYISHIHINDNDGFIDSHDAIGSGSIEYEKYKSIFDKDYTVLIEVSNLNDFVLSYQNLRKRGIINE